MSTGSIFDFLKSRLNSINLSQTAISTGVSGIEDNTNIERQHFDDGFINNPGYGVDVRAGRHKGVSDWAIIGRQSNITSVETVLSYNQSGQDITFMDSAKRLAVASTSASDVFLGAGCNIIEIEGLTETGAINRELVFLAGQTPVETGVTYTAVNRIGCVFHGATPFENVGDIYCSDVDDTFTLGIPDTRTYHTVENGLNVAQTAIYTVPSTPQTILVPTVFSFACDATENKPMIIKLFSRPTTVTGFFQLVSFTFSSAFGYFDLAFVDQVKPGGQIKFTVQAASGSTNECQLFFQNAVIDTEQYITGSVPL